VIRNLIVFLLFVFAISFAGMYLAYGQMDPCRALAVEQARRSTAPTSVARIWTRIDTQGMSRPACSKALARSWWDRLTD